MLKVLTAQEMREIDRLTTEKYGIPSILLMENAAHAAARVIAEKLGGSVKGKSFLILCGKGNNGGDGAALARILEMLGANVFVNLFGKVSDTKGDAEVNFKIFRHQRGVDCHQWSWFEFKEFESFEKWQKNFRMYLRFNHKPDCIIDALYGTGLNRSLSGISEEVIRHLCNSDSERDECLYISLDIPSGLNADSSEPIGTNFISDLTITFTAPKLANVMSPASRFNGELVTVDIGSPFRLIEGLEARVCVTEKQDAQNWFNQTKFTANSYKNKRGHALLIVGSQEYTGAAVLAGNAAMLSGVGLTTIATSKSAQMAVAAKVLEEIITHGLPETKKGAISEKAIVEVEKLTEKVDVIGIGCGLNSAEKTTKDFVRAVVEKRTTPVVIDADGLNALSPFDLQGSNDMPLILTPHEGEFLRLLGTKDKDAIKDRLKVVREFAAKYNVILVLKGERTLIAEPSGKVVINPTGNSGLGKAGNGDTLTGIITGFIAQSLTVTKEYSFYTPVATSKIDTIFDAVVAAIYIAGLAGDIAEKKFGKRSMLASDVRESIAEAFRQLKENE